MRFYSIVCCLLIDLSQSTFASHISTGPSIHITDTTGRTGLLWGSIGLAILTSLLQGLITTFVTIAEDQSMWTFRFRIARYEHHYWTGIAFFLSTSFALIVLSFLSGNNNDSLSVLALSTATALAIVRYAIPAWRNRHYIEKPMACMDRSKQNRDRPRIRFCLRRREALDQSRQYPKLTTYHCSAIR